MGAKLSRCDPIIAVDVHESKLEMAHSFGATHLVNARTEDAQARIHEKVGSDGVDYAVEAAGRADTIEQAFKIVRKQGGLCVFASHPPTGERICLDPHDLISGKQILGSWGGETNPDVDIPRFAELYLEGKLPLEKLITHRYTLDQINEALYDLEWGKVGRPIVVM
jgi:S-(hydroxymethyl)glutathione dehydrogenase/alcohol dehydrogenase